jgi:hypothetical protein
MCNGTGDENARHCANDARKLSALPRHRHVVKKERDTLALQEFFNHPASP